MMKKMNFGLIAFLSMILMMTGCDFMIDESRWDLGHGDLSDVVGDVDVSYDDMFIPDYNDFVDFNNFIEQTDFNAPSGEWFGGGKMGYGVPAGTKRAGDNFEIVLFGHDPGGVGMERDVRIQLHEIAGDYELGKLILEEEVFVEKIDGTKEIYVDSLPNEENVSYIVSVEVLDEAGNVEDTLLGLIYVPAPDVNARLSLDETVFEYEEDDKKREEVEVTLSLENYGPTFLSFGKSFVIEKLVQDEWRIVPLGLSFESIGIIMGINDPYEQTYDVSELNEGTYRFVKSFNAEGFDDLEVLAVKFTVE